MPEHKRSSRSRPSSSPAPDELRQELQPLSKAKLRDRCAGLRPGTVDSPLAAAKHALRALARRWQHLEQEIKDHDLLLDSLTAQAAPGLREAFGIGVDVAAEMLILAGDNPERIKSEAAFAKLCGACPIPASSRLNTTPPPELGRTPAGEQRALPLRDRPDALSPTHHRLRRPTHRRRQEQARNHPLPQEIPRPRDLPPHQRSAARAHASTRCQPTRRFASLTTIGASTPLLRASSTASRPSSSPTGPGPPAHSSSSPSSSTSPGSTTSAYTKCSTTGHPEKSRTSTLRKTGQPHPSEQDREPTNPASVKHSPAQ